MTPPPADILITMLNELVFGAPEGARRTYVLNLGDPGLIASLSRLTAESASTRASGGASVAAHVDHLRYALMLLNRWADGSPPPWPDMDWTTSWRLATLTEPEWRALREALALEATRWAAALAEPRHRETIGVEWMAASVAHLAYHVGAIRQLDRAAAGPTAEAERAAEARAAEEG